MQRIGISRLTFFVRPFDHDLARLGGRAGQGERSGGGAGIPHAGALSRGGQWMPTGRWMQSYAAGVGFAIRFAGTRSGARPGTLRFALRLT